MHFNNQPYKTLNLHSSQVLSTMKLSFILTIFCCSDVLGISDKIILVQNYSKDSFPPTEDGEAVEVKATSYIQNIINVNEAKQEMR